MRCSLRPIAYSFTGVDSFWRSISSPWKPKAIIMGVSLHRILNISLLLCLRRSLPITRSYLNRLWKVNNTSALTTYDTKENHKRRINGTGYLIRTLRKSDILAKPAPVSLAERLQIQASIHISPSLNRKCYAALADTPDILLTQPTAKKDSSPQLRSVVYGASRWIP
jgi:hypothetical protein